MARERAQAGARPPGPKPVAEASLHRRVATLLEDNRRLHRENGELRDALYTEYRREPRKAVRRAVAPVASDGALNVAIMPEEVPTPAS
jgi:hypothetical protein